MTIRRSDEQPVQHGIRCRISSNSRTGGAAADPEVITMQLPLVFIKSLPHAKKKKTASSTEEEKKYK